MKNAILLTLVMSVLAGNVFASTIEYDRRGDAEQVQICLDKSVVPSVGIFVYTCLTENWQECYAGPKWSGKIGDTSVEAAYGAGIESGETLRHGGWLWAGNGKLSAITLYENGQSGHWVKSVVKYQLAPKLSAGYVQKSFAGGGVYADYQLSNNVSLKFSGYKTPEIGLAVTF